MTKPELIEKLRVLQGDYYEVPGINPDKNHSEADGLLLEYINDPEVTEAFLEIMRWYS